MTPLDKQKQFQEELKVLLKKYKVEICIEDFGKSWVGDYKIVADFEFDESLYSENETGIVPQLIFGYCINY